MKKTCVITGNGPSLNDMPKELIEKYDTFGVNYCPYSPTYFVCVDHDLLIKDHEKVYDLAKGATIAFLPEKEKGTSNLYDLPNVQTVTHDRDFFKDEHFFTGLTVVYVSLKLAFYMGYQIVHLWGVDHNPEWNHYKEGYPVIDMKNRLARMDEMFYHYKLAQRVFVENDRKIINHSRKSRLDLIFPRR